MAIVESFPVKAFFRINLVTKVGSFGIFLTENRLLQIGSELVFVKPEEWDVAKEPLEKLSLLQDYLEKEYLLVFNENCIVEGQHLSLKVFGWRLPQNQILNTYV